MTTAAAGALACAGVIAAAPASAADMLALGVGGYMQQWFGYANRSDDGAEGGFAVHSDSEIHVKGSLESDMGLKYTVHVELEGDGANGQVDESFVRVSGEFGQIEFGFRDHAMVRMHSGIKDVGIGLTSGDTQAWIPGAYLETAGHAGTAGGGNDPKLNYISPRAAGLQVGLSYAPDDGSARTTTPSGNDDATWGAGLNFKQDVGDMNLTFSLGHRSVGMASSKISYMTGMRGADDAAGQGTRLTVGEYDGHKAAIGKYEAARGLMKYKKEKTVAVLDGSDDAARAADLAASYQAAAVGTNAIAAATNGMTMKGGDATYTNVGFGVGFGAFGFNLAYATSDGSAYKTMMANVPVTQADVTAINTANGDTNLSLSDGMVIAGNNTGDFDGDGPATDTTAESATNNDPGNDMWAAQRVVKDMSKDYNVWGASVSYSDGPMSVSLGHMQHEADDGGERDATMLSASYTLAPGVAWKSSVFAVEDTTVGEDDGFMNEGTGFVTGIALSF